MFEGQFIYLSIFIKFLWILISILTLSEIPKYKRFSPEDARKIRNSKS